MANRDTQFGGPRGNKRNPGAWKKADTPRYKLEQMIKLTEKELEKVEKDKNAPLFERKLAIAIIQSRWKEIESMINQVYGRPKETIEHKGLTPPAPLEDLSKKSKKK